MSAPETETPPIVDQEQPSDSTPSIDELLKLLTTPRDGGDSRQTQRHSVAIKVPMIPVDEKERPVGPPFVALSRDISSSGICFLHTRPVNASHLIVELRPPKSTPLRLLVAVMRCRAIGRFYEIGCQLLRQVDEKQTSQAAAK